MKTKKITLLVLVFALSANISFYAQEAGVSINTDGSAPDASAILDVSSTDKGILIPRMTEDQRNLIPSPAEGLLIYQTDGDEGFYYQTKTGWTYLLTEIPPGTTPGEMQYWDGSAWVTVSPGTTGQTLTFVNGLPVWAYRVSIPEVTNPETGEIWMDRNLGASRVATSSDDEYAYGDWYQWGRAADGHQLRTSGTTETLSPGDTPGHSNFILSGSDWRSTQNDNLWQGVAGTNNPCPEGFRLPTEVEWEAELAEWNSQDAAGAFNSPLKLTVAGYRNSSDGLPWEVGSSGRYWSSTLGAGANIRTMFFDSDKTTYVSLPRAIGYSVRCIKD